MSSSSLFNCIFVLICNEKFIFFLGKLFEMKSFCFVKDEIWSLYFIFMFFSASFSV